MGVTKFQDKDGVQAVNGILTKVDITNVTTPTAAEITAVYGAPTLAKNKGRIIIQDDNGADTTVKIIVSNGQSWFFSASLTKAS